jgi:hypothetical protein
MISILSLGDLIEFNVFFEHENIHVIRAKVGRVTGMVVGAWGYGTSMPRGATLVRVGVKDYSTRDVWQKLGHSPLEQYKLHRGGGYLISSSHGLTRLFFDDPPSNVKLIQSHDHMQKSAPPSSNCGIVDLQRSSVTTKAKQKDSQEMAQAAAKKTASAPKKDKTSALDQQINAAKERRANRANTRIVQPKSASVPPPPVEAQEATSKRKRLTPEEKAERQAQVEASRNERRQAREAIRLQKQAEREANKVTPHMKKVEKAAANLPQISQMAKAVFEQVTGTMNVAEAHALSEHLRHFIRVQRTQDALGTELKEGQIVKIVGGSDARYIGKTATVKRVQRIRCYVEVHGSDKELYLFTSDVKALSEKQASKVQATAASA